MNGELPRLNRGTNSGAPRVHAVLLVIQIAYLLDSRSPKRNVENLQRALTSLKNVELDEARRQKEEESRQKEESQAESKTLQNGSYTRFGDLAKHYFI